MFAPLNLPFVSICGIFKFCANPQVPSWLVVFNNEESWDTRTDWQKNLSCMESKKHRIRTYWNTFFFPEHFDCWEMLGGTLNTT